LIRPGPTKRPGAKDACDAARAGEGFAGAGVTRAGYVAILGRPNVGKSTLLNRILGEKVSITSVKPQTTRRRVAGIYTRGDAQVVFVDTPGLLDPAYALQRALADEVARRLVGVDLTYLVRDPAGMRDAADLGPRERAALAALSGAPVFLVLNKADLHPSSGAAHLLEAAREDPRFAEVHAVSAKTGAGVEKLLAATLRRLPAGGFFFDPEQLTDRSLRFLAAELVRETLFEELEQELPYASHVEVTDYDESRAVPRIEAAIYVERESQKGIVVGRAGATLGRIGSAARAKIERLAGSQVFLHLTVKVRRDWRKKDVELRRFGYRT
jgi:GTP-binding protein Era